jgi:hypothetical protein
MKIALQQVQQNIGEIANRHEYTSDILYELLAAYGRSKSAITQLREGHLNKAEDKNAVLQKDVVYFKTFPAGTQLEHEVIKLYEDPLTQRYNPRYLIATDLTNLAAKDNLKDTTLTIKLADIDDHLDFFYGWTGDEVVDTKTEAVADRRAADKMNELYVEIEKQNRAEFVSNPKFRHELNVFFTRLLFCFFAEDTGIYEDGQFTTAIKTYTQTDGSDLAWFFGELFTSLDTEDKSELKSPFKEFPYVNGSIFNTKKHEIAIPKFSAQARHLILECGRQNWGEINPDIFGTIFQGVVDPEHRDENGMDYTSVPNIMKVIKPLFLDGLHDQFDKYYDNEKKLWALLGRVQKIKVFDPACGSGNFLIIAYKELRQLQHAIISRIDELMPTGIGIKIPDNQLININNFYGIEIDDFAHELAVLSLFLAKHQMNQEFTEQFGKALSIIPLIDIPTIKQGNAARLDWQEICSNTGHVATKAEQESLFDFGDPEQISLVEDERVFDEIYLIGNPPYAGFLQQDSEKKKDMDLVFNGVDNYRKLDYVSIWVLLGAKYISGTRAKMAFVTTNSISQGEQVALLWPLVLDDQGLEILFAHSSFKWTNSARDNAGVSCIIAGLANKSKVQKYIYDKDIRLEVPHINGYITGAADVYIGNRSKQISGLPRISLGSSPYENGFLMLSPQQRTQIIDQYPHANKLIRRFIGSKEFIRDEERYCLWIDDQDLDLANSIEPIKERLDNVRDFRSKSKRGKTLETASTPHRFTEDRHKDKPSIIIPIVTSENREYMPIGYIHDNSIIPNSARAIYDPEPYIFSILASKMHVLWTKAVAGKLETRIRYSALVYNSFPIKQLTDNEKTALNHAAREILLARATHPDKTPAEMYNPDKMPADLREAHDNNDHLIENLYKKGGFTNDEARLAALFDLYEQMAETEKTK